MSERVMASIERVTAVLPHPNADLLEIYQVKGWQIIDRKDSYKVGDLAIYCEVDSWIPTELVPFLSKGKEPREFNGVKGERLRTIKLRGQLSQGLLLPLDIVEKLGGNYWNNKETVYNYITSLLDTSNTAFTDVAEGIDVSELFNIQKWEKPIPAQLAGQMKGNFPDFLKKTEQERIQNIPEDILLDHISLGNTFQITEKLHGTSCTFYFYDGEWGTTSRNVDLKLDQQGNAYVDMFYKLLPKLEIVKQEMFLLELPNFAVQGELCGPGINGNQYNLKEPTFFMFDSFSIDTSKYFYPSTTLTLSKISGIPHVPVLHQDVVLPTSDIKDLLTLAEGTSKMNSTEREGLVFKKDDRSFSFKVINNNWLLKND